MIVDAVLLADPHGVLLGAGDEVRMALRQSQDSALAVVVVGPVAGDEGHWQVYLVPGLRVPCALGHVGPAAPTLEGGVLVVPVPAGEVGAISAARGTSSVDSDEH